MEISNVSDGTEKRDLFNVYEGVYQLPLKVKMCRKL